MSCKPPLLPQNVVNLSNGVLIMSDASWWWVVAAAIVIAELMTGTIYLLMIALGFAAGAIAAHAGASLTVQVAVAAIVGAAATLLWHFKRQTRSPAVPAAFNTDMNQDIGAVVMVQSWNADGTAQVNYRGAQWTVQAASGAAQMAGQYRVKQITGSRLIVETV
jgi:membrane protein implicated in regulation of membrane protease activity